MIENIAQKRKEDAQELALMLYELYVEQESETGKVEDGQIDADQSSDE